MLVICHMWASRVVHICNPRSREHTRWVTVHCLMNMYCATLATKALVWTSEHTRPLFACFLVHVYHTLFYSLTTEDKWHHLFFIPLLCIPGFVWDWGPSSCKAVLFLNGVPGAILYGLVAYQRCCHIHLTSEPFITFLVNAFIRFPGAMWGWSCGHRACQCSRLSARGECSWLSV